MQRCFYELHRGITNRVFISERPVMLLLAAQVPDSPVENEAYSWATLGLSQAGLPEAATYFYIRTLQSGDKTAIRRALTQTEEILTHVGRIFLENT